MTQINHVGQRQACAGAVGLPAGLIAAMTGESGRAKRARIWQSARAFFITPQVATPDLRGTVAGRGVSFALVSHPAWLALSPPDVAVFAAVTPVGRRGCDRPIS